jgi:glycosyltransferase involved in cell wall biosynthesis
MRRVAEANVEIDLHAVTPYGPGAGSSRVRVFDWLERIPDRVAAHPYAGLSGAGPRTLLSHPSRVVRAERGLRGLIASRPGRLLLHREASPLSRGSLESRLVAAASVSVYDFDDALYCDTGEGPRYRRFAPKAPKMIAALRGVDRVIAGNDVLANWASEHHRDVVVIPSCVDPASYQQKATFEASDPPRLGWIGSWSTEAHLKSIADPLLALHKQDGARLTVLGSATGDLGPLESMVDRVPWSMDGQRDALAHFDVGLMPLRDDPYSRGKCGYKLLQYIAAGVPSVASPVGVNRQILQRSGLPGATTPSDWLEALSHLIHMSSAGRREMADRARRTVDEHYSFTVWRDRWRAAAGLAN